MNWLRPQHRRALSVPVLVMAIGVTSSALSQDNVQRVKEAALLGTVTSMTPDEVVINARGSDIKVPVKDVKKISFSDDPNELKRARDSILAGQIESALEDLKKIDGSSISRDVVRLDYEFYRAYCEARIALSGGGDKQAALNQLRKFVAEAQKTNYHVYEAAELLGDLAVALENYEGAGKFYAFLARSTTPEIQAHAGVLEGRTLVLQKKFPEAIQKYDAVIAITVDDVGTNRQKLFARIGKATCLAETGKGDEGIKLVEDIIAKNDERDVPLFARAYNAQGYCHLRASRPKDALLAFLHTHLLFNSDSDAHAESLYNLSKIWTDINKADQSVATRSILTSRYAGSLWAKKS